jgi:hypothetical protein
MRTLHVMSHAPDTAGEDLKALAELPVKPAAARKSPYIAGPWFDWLLFLLPPVLALVAGALISDSWLVQSKFRLAGVKVTVAGVVLGVLINAHLVAVFFRSHGNPSIFKLYPVRFIAVPLLLYAAMMSSLWVLVAATVLTVFWDVYHSALQTFGLARIYDRNHGNDPAAGRTLDLVLNHLLYAGPILGGATMLAHFKRFELFEDVESVFFTQIPAFMKTNHRYFTWGVVAVGTLFLIVYVLVYIRLYRRGYKISFLKVYLLASTGLCSIYTWGFNSWGQAFFIMNVFHAVQYLGLVWHAERKVLLQRLRLDKARAGGLIAAFLFLGAVTGYGVVAHMIATEEILWLWCITQVVALMHFWYDGFIWSVTKKQV